MAKQVGLPASVRMVLWISLWVAIAVICVCSILQTLGGIPVRNKEKSKTDFLHKLSSLTESTPAQSGEKKKGDGSYIRSINTLLTL